MKNILAFNLFILFYLVSFAQSDSLEISITNDSFLLENNHLINIDTFSPKNKLDVDSLDKNLEFIEESLDKDFFINFSEEKKLIYKRLKILDKSSPMDFKFNETNYWYIQRYMSKDIKLISRMLGLSPYYFSMIEQQLDKFQLPLELKFLAIVESALNPKARSGSGATGLWQFMYPTGKEYGLEVTSYIDERQDPLKSTIAACNYFKFLYSMFGDWNLVLAAYNGGPGTIKRAIAKTELSNYWELRPFLRKETQGYVPKFIALTYVMTFYKDYSIEVYDSPLEFNNIDSISFESQIPYYLMSEIFCVTNETINYLNPAYKNNFLPKGEIIYLPQNVIMDIVRNESYFYEYIKKVNNKQILVNEERVIYVVNKGDYLGKIAKVYGLSVADIKVWNDLHSDVLSIGDQLILYIPNDK